MDGQGGGAVSRWLRPWPWQAGENASLAQPEAEQAQEGRPHRDAWRVLVVGAFVGAVVGTATGWMVDPIRRMALRGAAVGAALGAFLAWVASP